MKRELRRLRPVEWRHPLQDSEPAAGFASRLAALNGRRLGRFLRDMKVPPRSLDRGEPGAVDSVAVLGGADAARLARATPRPVGDRRYEIDGQVLDRLSIARTYFKFCPHCVTEDLASFDGPVAARPWLRLEWTVAHFRRCDKHGVRLEKANPVRRPFEPFDFNEFMETRLRNLDLGVTDESLPPSPFQAWLRRRLTDGRGEAGWLDGFPLYAAVAFCETLGVSSRHPPKVATSTLSEEEWEAAAEDGFAVAAKGPDEIRALLARLNAAQSSTRGVWGPRDTYGVVYGLLQRTGTDPGYAAMRDLVSEFAMATMPLEPGSDVLGRQVAVRLVHTVRTAATETGVHPGTFRRWAKRSGVDISSGGDFDHRVTLDSRDVGDLVESLKGSMTTPQVLRLTGIPRLYMDQLIAGNHVETVSRSNGIADAKHRFTRQAAAQLMSKLFRDATPVSTPGLGQVSIQQARHAARCSIRDVLSIVLDGSLRWKGRLPGDDFGSLLVDRNDVVRIVRDRLPPAEGLTREEALKAISGVSATGLDYLIGAKLLDTFDGHHPQAQRTMTMLATDSVTRFKAQYVTLRELSEEYGLHYKTVKARLKRAGVDPALDPSDANFYAFDRAEVERSGRCLFDSGMASHRK